MHRMWNQARTGIRCSTPFGITEYIGGYPAAYRGARARVLNAFRHHGVYRLPVMSASECCTSAQRLSASRSISDATVVAVTRGGNLCSTPFGITEYIGASPLGPAYG